MSRAPLATSPTEVAGAIANLDARMEAIETGLINHRKIAEEGMEGLASRLETMQASLNLALAQSAQANAELKLWRRVASVLGVVALGALTGLAWLIDHATMLRNVLPK